MLNCIGEEADKVISALSYDKSTDPYEHLVTALTDYFVPQCNLTYERYRFRKLTQEGKIMPFVNELHQVAKRCDFENKGVDTVYNQNIRDQFILGLQSDELRRRLLSVKDLTLAKAIHIAVAHETSAEEAGAIKDETRSQEARSRPILNVSSRSSSPHFRRRSQSRKGNVRFDSEEKHNTSPVCYFCKKPGHFKKDCFKLKNAGAYKRSRRRDVFTEAGELHVHVNAWQAKILKGRSS